MSEERSSSDPLPYTQVDRAVKPKATQLASLIGTSPQHALGSLVEFWDLNGDPRDLEKLVAAGETEVLLDRETLITRFEIASGKTIEPNKLVVLGLVEPRGDRFRVRGMSRYFQPITRRMTRRGAASKAGKASAEARKERHGTAQPPSAPSSGDASADVPATFGGRSADVRETLSNTQRSGNLADSVQRTAVSVDPLLVAPPLDRAAFTIEPPTTPPAAWLAGDFFAWCQSLRIEVGFVLEKEPRGLGTWFSGACMKLDGDIERLCRAFESFGQDKYWEVRGFPFSAFMAQWEKFTPAAEVA